MTSLILLVTVIFVSVTYCTLDQSIALCGIWGHVNTEYYNAYCHEPLEEDFCDKVWYTVTCDTDKNFYSIILNGTGTLPALAGLNTLQELNLMGDLDVPFDMLAGLTSLTRLTTNVATIYDIGDFSFLSSLSHLFLSVTSESVLDDNFSSDYLGSLIITGNWIGTIPQSIGKFPELRFLEISHTSFNGSLPWQVSNLSQLLVLGITNNTQMNGSIPWEIGCSLNNLISLSVTSNPGISGTIPPQLGLLSNLFALQISGNSVSGTIPMELSFTANRFNREYLWCYTDPDFNSTANSLENIHLQNNNLTGTIPYEISNLNKLRSLILSNNKLTGTIPPELSLMGILTEMSLDRNPLTGHIAPEFGKMSSLGRL